MNVILSPQITEEIRQRYILLELDSFRLALNSEPVAAHALVEQLSMNELLVMQQYLDLHSNIMHNYRTQNWNYVEQAIDHLKGKWNRELDSFYDDLLSRVALLRTQQLDENWDGVIDKF